MLTNKPHILQNKLFIVEFAIQDSRKMMKISKKNQASKGLPVKKQVKNQYSKKDNDDKKKKDFKPKNGSNFKRKFIKK
jgi:hypothetical protein